jgi:hypothetical protein
MVHSLPGEVSSIQLLKVAMMIRNDVLSPIAPEVCFLLVGESASSRFDFLVEIGGTRDLVYRRATSVLRSTYVPPYLRMRTACARGMTR